MGLLVESLNWYQKKIGAYDKQQWEHSIEQRLSLNVNPVPKKTARIKTELIDLDLVRGSAFPKAKPQQSWLMSIYRGFLRVVFYPLHFKWWHHQTCPSLAITLLVLYLSHVISLYLYFFIEDAHFSEVPVEEVLIPVGMMLALGIVHSQIVTTFSLKHFKNQTSTTLKKRRKYKYKSKTSKPKSTLEFKKVSSALPKEIIPKVTTEPRKGPPKKISDEESGLDSLDMGPSQSSTDSVVQAPVDSGDEFFVIKPKGDPDHSWRRFSDLSAPNASPNITRRFSEGAQSSTTAPKNSIYSHNHCQEKEASDEKVLVVKEPIKASETRSYAPRKTVYSSGDSEPDSSVSNTPIKERISDIDWNIITNSDCNSDTSDYQATEHADLETFPSYSWEHSEVLPSVFHPSFTSSDKGMVIGKVSCTVWNGDEGQKVELTVLEISCSIIRQADSVIQNPQYLLIGLTFALALAGLPLVFRLYHHWAELLCLIPLDPFILASNVAMLFGPSWRVRFVVFVSFISRFIYSATYFFLLCVAERTFKQRFLYAKNFSHLTSSRRAKRSCLPHFRLNKVRNIKTWLSVRSYLKKRGPQRSVDVIVSTAFIVEICVLSFLCLQFLKETTVFWGSLGCLETMLWNLGLGVFLMRFMTLGAKINKKYRNLSVLITEQINLYLHMEQKPHKKEELMLANNVLKLAADLLKELESPFKISGLCANPYLYNITKVVVLSAFSAVLTELLGFKLKLHNIKIK